MALTKRVEVLFDPGRYSLLEQIARSHGETIGALVRRAVEQQYLGPTLAQRRAAVEGLLSEEVDLGTWEEAKAAIEREVVKHFETP